MKILVTGANGFMGRALCPHLSALGHEVVPAVRQPSAVPGERLLHEDDDAAWQVALSGCASIIHLAGRAHVMQDNAEDPLQAFRQANLQLTQSLARRAAQAGVKRLVFMSTIKVNGEQTAPGTCFKPNDVPAPADPYAVSKWEAEQALQEAASSSGLDVVIIRPPLVYGPGVKGNFASLVNMIQRGVPLPLGAVHNQRSLVGLDNLLSLVTLCADPNASPQAANRVWLVSDGVPVSTTTLLKATAQVLHVHPHLLPIPASWLSGAANLLGKAAFAERLLGSLVVDDSLTQTVLNWQPPYTLEQQLQRMKDVASA